MPADVPFALALLVPVALAVLGVFVLSRRVGWDSAAMLVATFAACALNTMGTLWFLRGEPMPNLLNVPTSISEVFELISWLLEGRNMSWLFLIGPCLAWLAFAATLTWRGRRPTPTDDA